MIENATNLTNATHLNRPAEGCSSDLLFKSFESLGRWRGGISELYHIEEVDSYEA